VPVLANAAEVGRLGPCRILIEPDLHRRSARAGERVQRLDCLLALAVISTPDAVPKPPLKAHIRAIVQSVDKPGDLPVDWLLAADARQKIVVECLEQHVAGRP